jgi:uncharacterized protein
MVAGLGSGVADGPTHALRARHLLLGGSGRANPEPATRFYTSLFGWDSEELSAGEAGTYTILRRVGKEVAILYRQTPHAHAAGASPHWTSYISVEDADATAARAADLSGAAVFRESFDVLDAGRVAAIADPTGTIVSLWKPRSLVGAALVNDVGAWCWNELITTELERAKAFFAELLGWEYETDERGYTSIKNGGSPDWGHARADRASAGRPITVVALFHRRERRRSRSASRRGGRATAEADYGDGARAARPD